MPDFKHKEIDEYIFAPFNTFIYLDIDEIRFAGTDVIREKIIDELNKEPIFIEEFNRRIEWCVEESEQFKISKGVFAPPGKGNSFIMARVVGETEEDSSFPIKEEVSNVFPANSLMFSGIRFYFHEFGVSTCSAFVRLNKDEGLTTLQLDEVSEILNKLYKQCFEDLSFQLAQQYVQVIRKLNIPRYHFDFFPELDAIEKSKYFIPWTHRVYHIQDDSLFELENPGELFQFLVTPSRQMDVEDLSIYDNRYIYFGWGHSIILTAGEEDGYSQTSTPVYDYVRLIEIAQANWQCLDVLADLVDVTIASFQKHHIIMRMKEIKKAIYEIRNFNIAIDRVLSYFRGVKITFDTEKRILLEELHERWLTNEIFEKLQEKMKLIEELLNDLYNRQKEKREESLNSIVLLFTIISIVEVFAIIFDILNPQITPLVKILIIAGGTILIALAIILYLGFSRRE